MYPTPEHPPDLPPIPRLPMWADLRVFLWGGVWAVFGGLGLAGALVLDSLINYGDYVEPIAWGQVRRMAVGGALAAGLAYWRKYKALLELPPGALAKYVERTTEITTARGQPAVTVETVKETTVEPKGVAN